MMAVNYDCVHEDLIQSQTKDLERLKTRADYKDKRIDELKSDIRDLKGSVELLDKTINDYIVKSIKDDNTLKDYITSLENRVTTIESRQDTLYKLLMAIPAILALLGLIAVYMQFVH
jgi:chromosome segregation ATPase